MPKGFRKNRKRVRRGPKRAAMPFAKRVLSVFNQQRELKTGAPLSYFITDVRDAITSATRPTNFLQILGNIPQGVDENQRVGNSITLKKIVMRGYYRIQFPVGNSLNCRILLRNLIMRQRNIENAELLTTGLVTANYNTLLEPANPYLGSVADYNTPINRDAFVVKKQTKRIMTAEWAGTSVSSTPALGTSETYMFFNYTMTFGKGKKLNYRTGGAALPEDFPYFLAHSASYLGSNTTLDTGAVGFNCTMTPYFYDA